MRIRAAQKAFAALAGVIIVAASCTRGLGRRYEYEEQLYLSVDGSATILLDASVAALVALRGVQLDPAPARRTDRSEIRRIFESAGCDVVNVGQPWRRDGRRFVQVRLRTDDVRKLAECRLLGWSTYTFEQLGETIRYRQSVGPPDARDPGAVPWSGDEIVAFKLHLPSRVLEHNVRRLADGEPGSVERGNILTWEQRFEDRRAGKPIEMAVVMASESILYQTLWLFGGAFVAAALMLVGIVWLVVRRGKKMARAAQPTSRPQF